MDNNILFETKYWNIFLNENQAYLGYSIIVLKRECKTLSEVNNEEWIDFHEKVVKTLETTFKEKFGATMFNWTCLMNDAYKKTEPNPLVHWHFRPRYNLDVFIGKEKFKDPNFAHHYDKHAKKIVSRDIITKIITRFNK